MSQYTLLALTNVVVALIAGAAIATIIFLGRQLKKTRQINAALSSSIDCAHTHSRVATQALVEVLSKLPAVPPVPFAWTDSTSQILLGLPVPLYPPRQK